MLVIACSLAFTVCSFLAHYVLPEKAGVEGLSARSKGGIHSPLSRTASTFTVISSGTANKAIVILAA